MCGPFYATDVRGVSGGARYADAQHGSDQPFEANGPADDDAMSLRAPRSDLVCEDCVKQRGVDGSADRGREDIRPRPQAGAGCVREKTQGQKHEILLRATGRGERGATS